MKAIDGAARTKRAIAASTASKAKPGAALNVHGTKNEGFNHFDFAAYLEAFKHVPASATANELPMSITWISKKGECRATHMVAGDFDAALRTIVKTGGKILTMQLAQAGQRWVPVVLVNGSTSSPILDIQARAKVGSPLKLTPADFKIEPGAY
jgi:hypothetical protein